jgi:hypothetical protein
LTIAACSAAPAPAAAQETQDRRQSARKACTAADRCTEPRRAYPWFFRGQDEGAQVRRRRMTQEN